MRRHPSDPTRFPVHRYGPRASNRQNSSGSFAPPGMRQPTPMTAIGSRRRFSTVSSLACNSSIDSQGALQWRELCRVHCGFGEINRARAYLPSRRFKSRASASFSDSASISCARSETTSGCTRTAGDVAAGAPSQDQVFSRNAEMDAMVG